MVTVKEAQTFKGMFTWIDPDNFASEVLDERRPVLLSCVRVEDGFQEQLTILKSLSEAYAGALKICLLKEDFLAAFHEKLGVIGTPTFIVLKGGMKVGRILGQVNENRLAAFLARSLPELEGAFGRTDE
ncbi:MAG: thioredoxin family protein [bacterium]